MNNEWRSGGRLWLGPAALLLATVLAAAAGWWVAVIVCACAGVVMALALALRRAPAARVARVELAPNQAAAVRAERERAGEVAAVRMLRTERPELSLVDAVRLVRKL